MSIEAVTPRVPVVGEATLNLRRLLLFRVVTATGLLLPALYYQALVGSRFSLAPVYALIGAIYGVTLAYAALERAGLKSTGFVSFQLTVDVILATLLVYMFGGVRSPLVLLYLLIAFAGGVMISRQNALAIACLTGVAYGLMAHLAVAEWMPQWELQLGPSQQPVSPPEIYLRLFTVLLSSCLTAAVANGYVSRLHRTRRQLLHERSALEALQQLNQQLLAGMSSGLIAADGEGRIIACNRAAERITQRAEPAIVGHGVEELLGLDAEALRDLDERLRNRQIYRTERQIRMPGGEYRTVGMSVTKVVEGSATETEDRAERGVDYSPGGPWVVHGEGPMAGGYIFMFQDLSDVKRMERMFWMRERMALLGEMASSLAHEIRNPLASISGSLQMLRRGDVGLETSSASRLMGIVTEESERLSRIIEDFLDYARPEKLEAAVTDLVGVALETIELMRNSPEVRAHHRIDVEAESESVVALVDAARIKQVFWNLARNALHAMSDGGALRIRLRQRPQGAEVVFEDEGCGMSADQIERIFRPFVSDRGTGLGLAVVYRIMQQHGGRIEVESDEGSGARFLLHFEDARVPTPGDDVVVVERRTESETRVFGELSRSIRGQE